MNISLISIIFGKTFFDSTNFLRSLAPRQLKLYALGDEYIRRNVTIEIKDFISEDLFYSDKIYYHALWNITRQIYEMKPDIVGFSCYLWNIRHILSLTRNLKNILPGVTTILGGPEVSSQPFSREIMEKNDGIDIIVRGEGEQTFRELVLSCLNHTPKDTIPGLTLRKENEILVTPDRTDRVDINHIPSVYETEITQSYCPGEIAQLETVRGCPYRCHFCLWPGKSSSMLTRSRIEHELRLIKKAGFQEVCIYDSILGYTRQRAKEIIQLILDLKLGLKFNFFLDLNNIDESIVKLAKKHENILRPLPLGVQTLHDESLKNTNIFFNTERFAKGIETIDKHHMTYDGIDLLIGLPGDRQATFKHSLNQLYALSPRIHIRHLFVNPGTHFFENLEKYGMARSDIDQCHRMLYNYSYSYENVHKSIRLLVGYLVLKYGYEPVLPLRKWLPLLRRSLSFTLRHFSVSPADLFDLFGEYLEKEIPAYFSPTTDRMNMYSAPRLHLPLFLRFFRTLPLRRNRGVYREILYLITAAEYARWRWNIHLRNMIYLYPRLQRYSLFTIFSGTCARFLKLFIRNSRADIR